MSDLQSPFASKAQRDQVRNAKKEAVLRAAVDLFNERGFHATSLDDIASRLGITKPAIYHYFGNKDQVLFHGLTVGMEQLRAAVDEARTHSGGGMDRLRAFLILYAEINMTAFGRCVILTEEHELMEASRRQFRALKREIDNALRELVREAVEDGTVVTSDVRLTAFTLAGALGWVARWYKDDGPQSATEIARMMVDGLMKGLAPR